MKKRFLSKKNNSNSVVEKSLKNKQHNPNFIISKNFQEINNKNNIILTKKSNPHFNFAINNLLPKHKNSQATLFVIIAIIALTAIFILINTYSKQQELDREFFEKTGRQPSIKNIQDFILDCHKETSKQALIKIGIQGGYYNKPQYYFDLTNNFIPYYYYEGLFLMPEKTKIENELSSYIDSNLNNCLNKIKFPNFDLNYQQPSTKTLIKPKETTFTTLLLITIAHNKDKIDFELSKHPLTLDSYLNEIIEVSDYITNSHKENPELMCINCISELAKERNLYVDFIAIEDDTTLVMLLENRTMEEPYIFEFMNKYIDETQQNQS